MSRIGIFSGTFDPIHEGHVLFAQTAQEQMSLDKVLFMPEKTPRRKKQITDLNYRAAMIQKAIESYDGFQLKITDDNSHSVSETLKNLKKDFPESDFLLIMGADVFEFVGEWTDFDKLSKECGFIVALRTEDDGEIVIPLADKLNIQVEFLPSPLSTISSSKIRQALLDNAQPKGLNDDVAEFIKKHQLYGT